MIGFERKRSLGDMASLDFIGLDKDLDAKWATRVSKIKEYWNFYEGYHWENLAQQESVELTVNYCRAFVDKFVAFELGKAFSFSLKSELEEKPVTKNGDTLFKYLESVWEDNSQYTLCTEIGQMKSITGEAWLQVRYFPPDELVDPFNEYENGRVKILLLPTQNVFPEYDPHQKGVVNRLTIMYSYEKQVKTPVLGQIKKERVTYKQVWTNSECTIYDGKKEPVVIENKYRTIPFVQIKNITVAGKNEGRSDLEDIIPLNTELNMKESNISEIIDYHAAPITIVYGAKIGNLEKGANKMWGGLSKESRVENLELKSDLGSSSNYIRNLKLSMCEVAGIPETVLGGAQAISNTSGVALQYLNLPLIEKTRVKKMTTEEGIEQINKLIINISLLEGLITKPEGISNRDFYWTEVKLPDTLPKDTLLELQQIQTEMKLGLESRQGAMKRIGRENIETLIKEIDEDISKNPDIYGIKSLEEGSKLNSGMLNGQTALEQLRVETTGMNGGGE